MTSRFDVVFSERLFARSVRLLPTIIKNFEAFKKILTLEKGFTNRRADQWGMLLSGCYSLFYDNSLDQDSARAVLSELFEGCISKQEIEEEAEPDEKQCLDHLLMSKVIYDITPDNPPGIKNFQEKREACIIELLTRKELSKEEDQALQRIGIRVFAEIQILRRDNSL